MTQSVSRAVVEAFYDAYGKWDVRRVGEFLADDVEWTISGPVDVLEFCGTHRGKAAVMDAMRCAARQALDVTRFEPSTMLIDGDRVATLNRVWGRHKGHDRVISYRVAHFMRFRDGKVVENLALLDSFDAVEQVLGHPLATDERVSTDGDLIAV